MSYQAYKEQMQEIADIRYASAVLQWDQETYMPANGAAARGRQIATLAAIAHKRFTSPQMKSILAQAYEVNGLTTGERKNVELSLYDFEKSHKLPVAFVKESSEAVNAAYHAWVNARRQNQFSLFETPLQNIIELKRKEAEYLGYEQHPYDALMNDYDRGLTVESVDALFQTLEPDLRKLMQICDKISCESSFLREYYPQSEQWSYGISILKKMHYNFSGGRQDVSEHPFTTNFSANDVRVTTRIDEHDFANMLWSCMHEGGHALYEQGLPDDEYGLPLGEYCSLSIHESQSRLWENCIGRSDAFWESEYSNLKNQFKTQLQHVNLQQFYKAINKVEPSLIRTEADEITYHFHVMIRYEIEKALIEGSLQARDVPTAWAEGYNKYLGLTVPNDRLGCLQDVHWSHGSFGYFPTYSIGSLYAAQFFETIKIKQTSVIAEMKKGNTLPVWHWLQEHIYRHGRAMTSAGLCKSATGKELDAAFFISYAKEKFSSML